VPRPEHDARDRALDDEVERGLLGLLLLALLLLLLLLVST
jgi:hypothetical protein